MLFYVSHCAFDNNAFFQRLILSQHTNTHSCRARQEDSQTQTQSDTDTQTHRHTHTHTRTHTEKEWIWLQKRSARSWCICYRGIGRYQRLQIFLGLDHFHFDVVVFVKRRHPRRENDDEERQSVVPRGCWHDDSFLSLLMSENDNSWWRYCYTGPPLGGKNKKIARGRFWADLLLSWGWNYGGAMDKWRLKREPFLSISGFQNHASLWNELTVTLSGCRLSLLLLTLLWF